MTSASWRIAQSQKPLAWAERMPLQLRVMMRTPRPCRYDTGKIAFIDECLHSYASNSFSHTLGFAGHFIDWDVGADGNTAPVASPEYPLQSGGPHAHPRRRRRCSSREHTRP